MNRHTVVVFDDYVSGTNTATAITSDEHARTLGMFDQIAIQLTATEISGTNPKVQCAIWHSAEGGNLWFAKSTTPQIPLQTINATGLNPLLGFDDGLLPNLPLVRLQVDLTATGAVNTRIALEVTLNDARESRFAAQMREVMQKAKDQNHCVKMIQGGSPVDTSDPRGWGAQLKKAGKGKYMIQDPSPSLIVLNPRYHLADDASVCVMRDGSVIVYKTGHAPIEVLPHKDGGKSSSQCG